MAEKCKKFPNQPHDLNKFDYPDPVPAAAGKDLTNNPAPTPTLPEYLYNVPGKAGGGKFKPVSGRTAAEAIVNGWTTLQHKRGIITNLTQIRWNKKHPTNEFLIRVSVPDPDNEGQTKEDETVWAPSSVFVHAQCDAATLATIMEMDPHEWRAFGTGKKAPRNSMLRRKAARHARMEAQLLAPQRLGGDCILAAMVSRWGGGLHSCVIDILCASCPAQVQHPLLSPESKGLLEMARSALGCSRHFAQGVDAIRTVVNDGGHQRIVVEHLVSCRFGRLAPTYGDGFYVFRVAPKGGNGWLFHAVACVVSGGDACWSEQTSGAYEGCLVGVVDIKKRKRKRGIKKRKRKLGPPKGKVVESSM
jgi:hypothetical protein